MYHALVVELVDTLDLKSSEVKLVQVQLLSRVPKKLKFYMVYKNAKKRQKDSAKKRQMLQELKKVPCMDCGKIYPPYVMDFDHRDPSEKVLNLSKVYAFGKEKLLAEVKKCDIVCSNCHRIRTFSRKDHLKNH